METLSANNSPHTSMDHSGRRDILLYVSRKREFSWHRISRVEFGERLVRAARGELKSKVITFKEVQGLRQWNGRQKWSC